MAGFLVVTAVCAVGPAAAEDAAPAGATYRVARRTASESVTARGRLLPLRTHEVVYDPRRFREEALVIEIAPPGPVASGTTLLRLDRMEYEDRLDDARREAAGAAETLAAAETALAHGRAEGEERLARMEMEARHAREALAAHDGWEAQARARDQEVEVRRHEANVADQEEELRQLRDMYAAAELATQTRDIVIARAERDLAISRERLQSARDDRRSHAERAAPQAREEIERVVQEREAATMRALQAHAHEVARLTRAVETAVVDVRRHERMLQEIEADAGAFVATATVSGIVVPGRLEDALGGSTEALRPSRAPARVSPGETVLTLIEVGGAEVRAWLPPSCAAWARPGRAVTVRLRDAAQTGCAGSLASIDPIAAVMADERLLGAVVRLEDSSTFAGCVPGTPLDVVLARDAWEGLAVPAAALQRDGVAAWCWRLSAGTAERREVKIGRSGGIWVEIVEGLAEGDEILLPAAE